MSCALTSGRTEGCFDNVGGIKAIYLLKYVDYPFGSIVRDGQEVIEFPTSTIYKYETQSANFNESIKNDQEGVSYSQSLTFTLTKQDLLTTSELDRAQKVDLRYLVEFNDGSVRFGGLYNGAQITTIAIQSGGTKSDLNGYNITIQGSEEISAPFTNLNILDGQFLLLEDGLFYLLEDNNKIVLE